MLDFIRIACAVPAVRVGDTAKKMRRISAPTLKKPMRGRRISSCSRSWRLPGIPVRICSFRIPSGREFSRESEKLPTAQKTTPA